MILGIGPYIGSFEHEILSFRPYAKWICENVDYDNVYLNTHHNRLFMYDFIPKSNRFEVYRNLSRDETKLKGYRCKDIDVRDFNFMSRDFKNKIYKHSNSNKKNILIESINYTKKAKPIPIYKKIFTPIITPDIEIPESHKNRIVIIPDKIENIKKMEQIIHEISHFDPLIIGNINTNFPNENIILKKSDYFENVYRYVIKYIMESRLVVCPLSFWTLLCNIQKISVVSWGINVSQYKRGGIYNLDNDKSLSFFSDKTTSIHSITDMIEYFMEKNNGLQ